MVVGQSRLRTWLKSMPTVRRAWQSVQRLRQTSFTLWLRLWLPVRLRFYRPRPHGLHKPLIVSLTSHPPRFKYLPLTLKCLLCQSVRPDHLILWIAREHSELLPVSVLALQRHGLQIAWVDDLKSYKKLLPALQAYGFNVNHVVVDDDMYQAPGWLEALVQADAPGAVACHFSRLWRDADGQIPTYRQWPAMSPGTQSTHGLLIGHGGVLFPPGSLGPEVCDYALASQLCPRQDDIWFTWHALMRGFAIHRVSQPTRRFSWPGADNHGVALSAQNNPPGGGNDLAMQCMINHYGIELAPN